MYKTHWFGDLENELILLVFSRNRLVNGEFDNFPVFFSKFVPRQTFIFFTDSEVISISHPTAISK